MHGKSKDDMDAVIKKIEGETIVTRMNDNVKEGKQACYIIHPLTCIRYFICFYYKWYTFDSEYLDHNLKKGVSIYVPVCT